MDIERYRISYALKSGLPRTKWFLSLYHAVKEVKWFIDEPCSNYHYSPKNRMTITHFVYENKQQFARGNAVRSEILWTDNHDRQSYRQLKRLMKKTKPRVPKAGQIFAGFCSYAEVLSADRKKTVVLLDGDFKAVEETNNFLEHYQPVSEEDYFLQKENEQ